MADETDDLAGKQVGKRGIDPLALLAGIATLLVSAYVLTDGDIWVPSVDGRWVLAGGAVLVGLLLLAASMRGDKRKKKSR
ncbi:hypothetical protein EV193_106183 [Herbihabitans rhizosphaerae]|uniref:Uncharacterized protein n=1 Tax=Herbihabitans rhizosphaerae TaxID=1872711 RepID=A0A4Q7KK69_9PSEU|nr:hypothetical protein [Herbihabitans rhizosphaerae]RZS36949.1 hypothetical protein EV193_106183 [Herbihabitans rhizosphaerae]